MGDEFLQLEKYVNLNYMGFHKVGAGAVGWRTAGGGLCCKSTSTWTTWGSTRWAGIGGSGGSVLAGGGCGAVLEECVNTDRMGLHKAGAGLLVQSRPTCCAACVAPASAGARAAFSPATPRLPGRAGSACKRPCSPAATCPHPPLNAPNPQILKKHDKMLPHTPCRQFYISHLHNQPWVQVRGGGRRGWGGLWALPGRAQAWGSRTSPVRLQRLGKGAHSGVRSGVWLLPSAQPLPHLSRATTLPCRWPCRPCTRSCRPSPRLPCASLSVHPQGNYSDLLVALSAVYSELRGDAGAAEKRDEDAEVSGWAGLEMGWLSWGLGAYVGWVRSTWGGLRQSAQQAAAGTPGTRPPPPPAAACAEAHACPSPPAAGRGARRAHGD